jgi:hypothetical protein
MGATQAQQEFAGVLKAYLASENGYRPFTAFLKSHKFGDLSDAISTYFDVTRDQDDRDTRSLNAFRDLALAALEKGDKYFALRFEALTNRNSIPWHRRYAALDAASRARIAAQVASQKAHLSGIERAFLDRFARHLKHPDQKGMERFVDSLKFQPVYECLLAYIEVSQAADDTDKNSLVVFYGLSYRALGQGDSYFAAKYDSLVHSDGFVWKRRYDALEPWQRDEKLAPAIRDAKQIVTVTKYHDKDVTEKHPIAVRIAPERAQPADQLPTRPETAAQRAFVEKFHDFMSRRGMPKDKRDVEFTDFISSRPFPEARDYLDAYLKASTRYADKDERSLSIFFGLAARAITKGDAYYAFKFTINTDAIGTPWARRYGALNTWQHTQLQKRIAERRALARLIDDLKIAYFEKNQRDPGLAELRSFETPIDDRQALALSKVIDRCGYAFVSHNAEDFDAGFDALSDILKAEKDLLVMLTMARRCRTAKGLTLTARHLLYWYMAGALYVRALNERAEVYKRGLHDEERALLFHNSDIDDAYFNDFVFRLDYLWMRYQSHDAFTKISKANAMLHVFAGRFDMRLLPLEEAAAVHGLVELAQQKNPKLLDDVRIPVFSRRSPGKTLKLFETRGRVFIRWWDGSHEAYLQIDGFEGLLFGAESYRRLGQIYDDDAFYGEIYRGTSHLLTLIPAFFELLGYIPDLVTGGLSGLVKSILFNVALEKACDALGVDSNVGQLIAMGAGLLAHHAFGAKEGGPSAELESFGSEEGGARQLGDTGIEDRHNGTDMRGSGDHPIPGEENYVLVDRGLDSPHTGDRTVHADGVADRTVSADAPRPTTRQDLASAEQDLKEAQAKFDAATREMEHKKNALGDSEAKVEDAQGKRHLPQRERELAGARKAERDAVAEYRKHGYELRAAQSRVDRVRSELAARGELDVPTRQPPQLVAGNEWDTLHAFDYQYRELYVRNPDPKGGPFKLDGYDEGRWIVSRKKIDLSKTPQTEVFGYIDEFASKYARGTPIVSEVPSSGLQTGGLPTKAKLTGVLRGQYVLEVPIQTSPVPPAILSAAKKADVIIRDVAGTVYHLP